MKRWICAVMTLLMLLPVFTTTAFAAGHDHGHSGHSRTAKQHCVTGQVPKNSTDCVDNGICASNCQYIDENGDNVCDNCKNACAACGVVMDDNADGICDNCGKCSHYADENNDGICDHQADCENRRDTETVYPQNGHHGRRHRNHH